jgi:hypothetical protein
MTAAYTFDIFSTLDGFGSHRGDWGGYGAGKAPNCSIAASPYTASRSGWSLAPPHSGHSCRC